MSNPLATVIATALEAARILDEERVRQLIREELANWRPAIASGWKTPPAGARHEGVSNKRVYALMDAGLVEKRAKNPDSANPKWEISMSSLHQALAGEAKAQPEKSIDAKAWAARRSLGKGAA